MQDNARPKSRAPVVLGVAEQPQGEPIIMETQVMKTIIANPEMKYINK